MKEDSADCYLEATIDATTKRFPLKPSASCSIGRGEHNTIVLRDNQVSRSHAIVEGIRTGQFSLADLGSRNGTFINKRRVTMPVVLKPGDCFTIGGCELTFYGECAPDPVAQAGETAVDIVTKTVLVLVIDIRDFTGLSRRLPEARLSELVSSFMRDTGAVLARHGAWSQKYIGDAVMAVWLLPGDDLHSSHLAAVFEALLELFDLASGLKSRFGLDAPVRIGAGLNAGPASVGNMGSDAGADYTALSDTVNLAFRLESATKSVDRDLAVGESVFRFLEERGAAAGLFESHVVSLKGYREPQPLYAAEQARFAAILESICRLEQAQ